MSTQITIPIHAYNDLTDELGRIHAGLIAIHMATSALPLDQQSAVQQVNMDALDRVNAFRATMQELRVAEPVNPHLSMSTTDLLEANRTLLAARHLFCLQSTRFRFQSGPGGEQVRAWAARHLQSLDEEIWVLCQEMDTRDLSDEDQELEREIVIRESQDVLPVESPFVVTVSRRAAS